MTSTAIQDGTVDFDYDDPDSGLMPTRYRCVGQCTRLGAERVVKDKTTEILTKEKDDP
jgi:hypothetical protein